MRGAFVFDPHRCTGCQACELACSIENRLGTERSWRGVLTFNPRSLPGIPVFHLSLACNHCEHAACMDACPALAYERDPRTGAVLIRQELCIGCRYCSWACPYGAPRFEPENGVMGKCTFCAHRLADGLKPACASLCPTGALDYAELPADLLTADVEGMPRTDLGPSLRVVPGSRGAPPSGHPLVDAPAATDGISPAEPSIRLSSEWSLGAFTFLLALLFGLLAAEVAGVRPIPTAGFAILSGLAGLLSLAHLGRPGRAWRAGLNVRRSPVSREVLGFAGLAFLGTLALALPDARAAAGFGGLGLAAGLLALTSADAVYRPVYPGKRPALHSGGTLLTGAYLAGLVAGSAWLAAPVGALKLLLYASRTLPRDSAGDSRTIDRIAASVRIGCGLLVPGIAWVWIDATLPAWAIGAALVGEAVDRAQFYTGLTITSPARQIRTDLAARLDMQQRIRA